MIAPGLSEPTDRRLALAAQCDLVLSADPAKTDFSNIGRVQRAELFRQFGDDPARLIATAREILKRGTSVRGFRRAVEAQKHDGRPGDPCELLRQLRRQVTRWHDRHPQCPPEEIAAVLALLYSNWKARHPDVLEHPP